MGYNRFGQDTDSSLPVGATVPTVITTNDPSKPNWLNLSLPNTLVDITTYPSFSTVNQSNYSGSIIYSQNLGILLGGGTWDDLDFSHADWCDGLYWAFKKDGVASYVRVFTSVDGITWTEKANLTKDASSYPRPEQIRIKKLSDGYVYVTATTGVYRTNNSGTSWTHLLAGSGVYWGDIAYNGVTYVLTGGSGAAGIETTTDFVTRTQRHTLPFGNGGSSQIYYSPTFSKFYVHCGAGAGANHWVCSSSDGISGWSNTLLGAPLVNSTAQNGRMVVEFNGVLVLVLGGTSVVNFKSTDGSTWVPATNLTNAMANNSSYGSGELATSDAFFYGAGASDLWYVNNLTSSTPRGTSGNLNNAYALRHDTVNNRIVSLSATTTQVATRYLPYLTTTNKVFMPVQNTLVRVY